MTDHPDPAIKIPNCQLFSIDSLRSHILIYHFFAGFQVQVFFLNSIRKNATAKWINSQKAISDSYKFADEKGCSRSMKCIKEFRYVLLESDSLDLKRQIPLLAGLKMPVVAMTFSGNESYPCSDQGGYDPRGRPNP